MDDRILLNSILLDEHWHSELGSCLMSLPHVLAEPLVVFPGPNNEYRSEY